MFDEDDNIKPRLGEVFYPLDEDERKHREQLMANYRDRAEERRQREKIDEKQDEVFVDGEEQIQLKGLDYNLMKKTMEENAKKEALSQKKKEEISKIKLDLLKVKKQLVEEKVETKVPKAPMAIKLAQYFNETEQIQMKVKSSMNTIHYYEYLLGQKENFQIPSIISKQREENQDDDPQFKINISEKTILAIEEVLKLTKEGTEKRKKTKETFTSNIIEIKDKENEDEEIDNDIFEQVKDIDEIKKQYQIQQKKEVQEVIEEEEENDSNENAQNKNFKISDYIEELNEEDMIVNPKNIEKTKYEIELQKQKDLKHKKMLEEYEDYYEECYQPVGISLQDQKKQLEVLEEKDKLKNQKQTYFDPKKMKKKVNYNKQLDQIEDIIKKKQKPN